MYHLFENNDELIAFTTTNQDGYSKIPYQSLNLGYHVADNNDDVLKNHLKLAESLNYNYDNLYFANQTHSTNLQQITKDSQQISDNTDALYTKEPNKYLGVMTADCLPILGYDHTNHLVFAIHAGWLGSSRLITYKTIDYLMKNENLDLDNTTIYFGPSIFQDNYQVGSDVYEKILATPFADLEECFVLNEDSTYQFDNRLYNIKQLTKLGFNPKNIIKLDECTYQEDHYFSYRKDRITGRMMSIIALKKEL